MFKMLGVNYIHLAFFYVSLVNILHMAKNMAIIKNKLYLIPGERMY